MESLYQDYILHNISQSVVDHDVFIFLAQSFKIIAQKRALFTEWPGEQAIARLVEKTAGLFIWTATAYRFIYEGRKSTVTQKRLQLILQGESSIIKPGDELNKAYITVLKNSIGQGFNIHEENLLFDILRNIIGGIVVLLSPLSADALANLLRLTQGEVEKIYILFWTFLKNKSLPIRLHHPSFRDFILNPERCSDQRLWVDKTKANAALANGCLWIMSKKLREDICDLHLPGAEVKDVHNEKIEQCLPAELQYACRYWVQHLQQSKLPLLDNGNVHLFLQEHLLFWLEALSILKKFSEGVLALIPLENLATVSTTPNLKVKKSN